MARLRRRPGLGVGILERVRARHHVDGVDEELRGDARFALVLAEPEQPDAGDHHHRGVRITQRRRVLLGVRLVVLLVVLAVGDEPLADLYGRLPIGRLADPVLLAIYLVAALLIIALTLAVTVRRAGRSDGVTLRDAAFGALVAAFPNAGFMGVPLLVALLGAAAAGPAIVTIVVDLVVTTSLCVALSRLAGADEHRLR